MPFSFENRVGRLIEITMTGLISEDDAQRFRTRMFLALSSVSGRAVLFGDMRGCNLFSSDVRIKMVAMLKQDSPKVERSAFLLDESPMARQIERIITEAALEAKAAGRTAPPRQIFRDLSAAQAWVSEVLTVAERVRLAEAFPA
jgi:hypothetical protein